MYNDQDDSASDSPDKLDTDFMPAWRFIRNFVKNKAPDFDLDQIPDPVATFMMDFQLGVGPYNPDNNDELVKLAGSADRRWFQKKRQ